MEIYESGISNTSKVQVEARTFGRKQGIKDPDNLQNENEMLSGDEDDVDEVEDDDSA